MATPVFFEVFEYLGNVGYFQIIVPFLLVFVVIYALLAKTGMFGKDNTGVNILVGLLIASLAVVNTRLVEFASVYLGTIAVISLFFAITVLFFMAILKIQSTGLKVATAVLAILAVFWTLLESQYYSPIGDFTGIFNIFTLRFTPYAGDFFAAVVLVIVIWLVVLGFKKTPLAKP